jgi:hypothetical protein
MKTDANASSRSIRAAIAAALAVACILPLPAGGQNFDLSWYTIDGGGGSSAGGDFELTGTIGQPDAGAMTGGEFEMAGGFWPGASGATCDPCDANCDGAVDAFDVEHFIAVLLSGGGCAACTGDVNGDGVIDAFDIEPFVNCLVGP